MTSPALENLAPELKLMILKGSDAASIRSLILASPAFYRVFCRYYTVILQYSVVYSSGVRPEVLNDALAAASLPYPPDMNNADKETRKDEAAAEKAVRLWKYNKFAFAPTEKDSPIQYPGGRCAVPGFDSGFNLRHAAELARLSSYIEGFIDDYVAKARCDPLKDFDVYNNVPYWADETLKSLNPNSPIDLEKKKAIRLTTNELIKFQRAFFRFEFYARVHANSPSRAEYDVNKNPLIKLAPSQTEEVACAYSYLFSLLMLAFAETDNVDELKKTMVDGGRTFPVRHVWDRDHMWLKHNSRYFIRVKLASGIERLWNSLAEPYETRRKLVSDDIHRRTQTRDNTLGGGEFMRAVLNGDPYCCFSCCINQWGLVFLYRGSRLGSQPHNAIPNPARLGEGGILSSGIMPNSSWKWRNRQIHHIVKPRKNAVPQQREAERIIATRRMCAWVFWDDRTLKRPMRRYRLCDFKEIDMKGFLLEEERTT
ncbi:hypothetical protein PG985_000286 [Apiospora marii]|uniref:Uncharacterized protein n=1 Tax=Apiospora marii TaxID=335849 RepID=A0ABR1R2E4_9PEZI